jgi:uncharacterized protein YqjF (DUF2071 family)
MFSFLKHHPVPIQAFFDFSLVLTYAWPESVLKPLLPPGLTLDTYNGVGFVAIAFVQTRALRPLGFPVILGRDFFLSGYRIFTRYQRPSGQELRGLRILRSDTDSRLMAGVGNALTHYNYRFSEVRCEKGAGHIFLEVRTPGAEADILLKADFTQSAPALPSGSPFPDWVTARRYAGPLPFTFDYEAATHRLILIEGVRKDWNPQPVSVDVKTVTFFDRPPFNATRPVLANAFIVQNIPYRWHRGVLEKLPEETR